MAAVFYRYRDASGAWVVTDRLDAVPASQQDDVDRIILPDLPAASSPPPAEAGEADPPGGGTGVASWVQGAREAVPAVPAPLSRIDGPSLGLGFGLGLAVFVVYAILRRSAGLFTRLALVALVVALVGASLAGMWVAPRVPGAPEWLVTPVELIREAKRVAEEAAPKNRLGDLE